DSDGRVLDSVRSATAPERGFDGVVEAVVGAVRALGPRVADALAIGVGVAGQVDSKTGTVRYAPNLQWRDAPLGPALESILGLPVVVTNDVRAAAWGEWHHGAGQGVDDLVVLFVGTGIGGGVVAGGRLLEGCSNAAGELGHMTIVHGGRQCRCRNRGCLEAYAGGWAIAERSREAVEADPEGGARILEIAGSIAAITGAAVTRAAIEGDAFANALIAETTDYLASGIVARANAFNPAILGLGGGGLEGRPDEVNRLRALVRDRALDVVASVLRIEPARLGGDAGVIGAAGLATAILGRTAD